MENVLPALIAMAVLIFGAAATYRATDQSVGEMSSSWKRMAHVANERAQTQLTPGPATVDGTGFLVEVPIDVSGGTLISAYTRMDVIVEYHTLAGTRVVASLDYVGGAPGAGQWTVASITPDIFDPRVINPGERAVLQLRLANELGAGYVNRVTVAAPNGTRISATFTR